jgi:hypothetical protein
VSGLSLNKVPIGRNLAGPNPSLSPLDGSVAIDSTSQNLYYVVGNVWRTFVSSTLSVGPVGAAPNANAATVSGSVLNLQPASVGFPGVVTTGAQVFNGTKTFSAIVAPGTNYTAVAPLVATDNNSFIINNSTNQIAVEFADATHNGIVSTVAQSFNGTKTFTAIVAPGTNYATVAPVVAINNNGFTINNTTNQIAAELADATHNGIVSTAAQSFGGTKTFTAIVAPGTNYAAVAPIVATDNNSFTINNTTNQIAAELADATHNGVVSTATQAFSGIKQFENGVQMLNITAPGYSALINTPTYFEQDSRIEGTLNSINLTGNAGVNTYDFPWHLQKCGRIVFMGLGSSGAVVLSAPGAFLTCPAGTIPSTYRPQSVLQRRSPCIMVTNGANTPAYVEIFPNGSMNFAIDAAMTTGFTGVAGTSDCTVTYTI